MKSRKMICAGRFYPASSNDCVSELQTMFEEAGSQTFCSKVIGGIVPHAGWVFSGATAAKVFAAVSSSQPDVDTFVVFGACHSGYADKPVVYDGDLWQSPIGELEVDRDLTSEVLGNEDFEVNDFVHSCEHSIEVNAPFIKYKFPKAKILPIIVPPESTFSAIESLGEVIASACDKKLGVVGSSDLTHYGRDYGFTPAGSGVDGCKWAKEVNDKSIIDRIEKMDAKGALEDAMKKSNACGPGAIAAAITLSKKLGAGKAQTLAHTHSSEILLKKLGTESDSSVGYAAIVFSGE